MGPGAISVRWSAGQPGRGSCLPRDSRRGLGQGLGEGWAWPGFSLQKYTSWGLFGWWLEGYSSNSSPSSLPSGGGAWLGK